MYSTVLWDRAWQRAVNAGLWASLTGRTSYQAHCSWSHGRARESRRQDGLLVPPLWLDSKERGSCILGGGVCVTHIPHTPGGGMRDRWSYSVIPSLTFYSMAVWKTSHFKSNHWYWCRVVNFSSKSPPPSHCPTFYIDLNRIPFRS